MAAFHRLSKIEEKLSNSAQRFRDWEERNRAFHEALIAACDSRWLRYLIGILYRQSERYRRFALNTGGKRDVHAEHQAIYEAAMARDEARACAALEKHIGATLAVMEASAGGTLATEALRRPASPD